MTNQNKTKLFGEIKETGDDDLEQAVAAEDGRGGTVTARYRERNINYINVSESELYDLSSLNLGAVIFSSIGSFFFALWIDIFKDKKLSESIPHETLAVFSYIQPLLIIIAGLFALLGIGLWFIKYNKIKKIIKECSPLN